MHRRFFLLGTVFLPLSAAYAQQPGYGYPPPGYPPAGSPPPGYPPPGYPPAGARPGVSATGLPAVRLCTAGLPTARLSTPGLSAAALRCRPARSLRRRLSRLRLQQWSADAVRRGCGFPADPGWWRVGLLGRAATFGSARRTRCSATWKSDDGRALSSTSAGPHTLSGGTGRIRAVLRGRPGSPSGNTSITIDEKPEVMRGRRVTVSLAVWVQARCRSQRAESSAR